jgi:hypothetical protein
MSMTRNVETTMISNEFQPKGNNDMMQCVTCKNPTYLHQDRKHHENKEINSKCS